MVQKTIGVSLSDITIQKLHQIKNETGIPISKILEKSFEKVYGGWNESNSRMGFRIKKNVKSGIG